MAISYFKILGHQFDVKFEWDPTCTSYPVQFIFFNERRVGLFDENDNTNTIYFDSVTMTQLLGEQYTSEHFSIGINFGLFDETGLTIDEINDKKQSMNIMIKSAKDVLQLYFITIYGNK